MADLPEWAGPKLMSDNQALEVGYEEGAALRENGGQPKDLDNLRGIHFEVPYPMDRGENNQFHAAWQLGFDAEFMDEEKPCL